jgi:hypothetical protein
VQLTAAFKAGVRIPRSTVASAVALLAERHTDGLVAKNLADLHLSWAEEPDQAFLTHEIDIRDITDAQVAAVPVLFQDRLVAAREFRAVFIGDQCFSTAIDQRERAGHLDVRTLSGGERRYKRADLHESTLTAMRQMLRLLGLDLCAADIIETPSGDQILVDLNSCGAWWWVDDRHDGAVTQAIASYLVAASESQPAN